MNKAFVAESLNRRPALLREILRFNGVFLSAPESLDETILSQVHTVQPDMRKDLLVEVFQLRRARRHLRRLAPPPQHFWDFAEESRRLALLEPETILKLAMTFGTAVHASSIAKLIIRDDVLELRKNIGAELYEYAMHRGQFQLGTVTFFFQKNDTELPLSARIRKHGILAFNLCAATWPKELQQRLSPYLPFKLEGPREPLPAQTERSIWFGLKKILLKEVAPQWAPCFA